MAEGCAQKRGAPDYSLVASVTHLGRTPASGHYVADCRQPDSRFLTFDDDRVSLSPLARVLNDRAYLLFYQLSRP